MPADKLSDFGQDTFTAAQINAIRKLDKENYLKSKKKKTSSRIRTK